MWNSPKPGLFNPCLICEAKLTIGSTLPIRHSWLWATPQDLWELFTFRTCKQLHVCEKAESCSSLGAASQDHCSRQGRAADTLGFALCKYFLCPGSTETTSTALPVGWKVSHPEAAVGTQLTSSKQSLSGMRYPQFRLGFQVTKWRDAWNSYWVPRLLHA